VTTLGYIILATFLVSLASLVGVITLSIKTKTLQKYLLYLVSLSAGTLIGGAFIHLLPEAIDQLDPTTTGQIIVTAFIGFFFIEKVLHWHHCHDRDCPNHSLGYLNLIADAIHNFIDGLVIAATFLVDIKLGVATTIAVALHEIPQEFGDFGVLLYSGFSRTKAILSNLLVALTAITGGVLGFYLAGRIDHLVAYLLPLAAGSFIYIAASDLMPEIKQETSLKHSIISFTIFVSGIGLMLLLKE